MLSTLVNFYLDNIPLAKKTSVETQSGIKTPASPPIFPNSPYLRPH